MKTILDKFTGWDLVEYWHADALESVWFYDKNGDQVITVPLERLIVWYLGLNTFGDFIDLVLKKAKEVK